MTAPRLTSLFKPEETVKRPSLRLRPWVTKRAQGKRPAETGTESRMETAESLWDGRKTLDQNLDTLDGSEEEENYLGN